MYVKANAIQRNSCTQDESHYVVCPTYIQYIQIVYEFTKNIYHTNTINYLCSKHIYTSLPTEMPIGRQIPIKSIIITKVISGVICVGFVANCVQAKIVQSKKEGPTHFHKKTTTSGSTENEIMAYESTFPLPTPTPQSPPFPLPKNQMIPVQLNTPENGWNWCVHRKGEIFTTILSN